MGRVKFRTKKEQRSFFDLVIFETNSPSLRGLLQFGISTNYSTLKNYYIGERRLPGDLFDELCIVSGVDKGNFEFEVVGDNWGKIKGGKKGRRGKVKLIS